MHATGMFNTKVTAKFSFCTDIVNPSTATSGLALFLGQPECAASQVLWHETSTLYNAFRQRVRTLLALTLAKMEDFFNMLHTLARESSGSFVFHKSIRSFFCLCPNSSTKISFGKERAKMKERKREIWVTGVFYSMAPGLVAT